MNPQQTSQDPGSAEPPSKGLSHAPTQDELLELGMLAIEDAHMVEIADSSPDDPPQQQEVVVSLSPTDEPVHPAPPPDEVVPAPPEAEPDTDTEPANEPADVPAAEPASVVVPTNMDVQLAPSTGDVLDATQPPQPQQPQQAVPAVAPAATPAKARDVAVPEVVPPPVDPTAGPEVMEAPAPTRALPSFEYADMDLSANSQQMKGVARLHIVNLLLYGVLVILIGAVVVGGWYLYQYLKTNSVG